MRIIIYSLSFLFVLSTNTLISQNSGRGFNFQSLVRDKDGQILKSKPVQIFVKYYLEGTFSTLFEESQNLTTDDFGAIATVCGSGQKVSGSLAKFSDINFGSGNIWYAVSIMDGGVKREIANQKFYSVPYAETAFNVSPVPSGTILPFAGENVPAGYLACDGSEYSKSQYPALFNAIQNIWGTASNNNNFRVPDLRGLFLRGVDGTANRDPDKTTRTGLRSGQNSGNRVGSYQQNEFKSHDHILFSREDASPNNTQFIGNENTYPAVMAFKGVGAWSVYNIVSSSLQPTMHKSKGAGGNETRPSNIYVLYIIKI